MPNKNQNQSPEDDNRLYIPSSLSLTAEMEILSREDEEERGETKARKFLLKANTGRPMRLSGFLDPVIVDFSKAKFGSKRTPVIADHDVRARVGHTTEQAVIKAGETKEVGGRTFRGPLIVAMGVVSSSSQFAQEFLLDAEQGFPFQVSLGADTEKAVFLDEGLTQEINGRTVKGPLIVAGPVTVHELSVLVLGADKQTSAKLVAGRSISIPDLSYLEVSRMAKAPNQNQGSGSQPSQNDQSVNQDSQRIDAAMAEGQGSIAHNEGNGNQGRIQASGSPSGNSQPFNVQQTLEAQNRALALNMERVNGINSLVAEFSGTSKDLKIGDQTFPTVQAAATHAIQAGMDKDHFELLCRRHSQPTNVAIHSAPQVRNLEAGAVACAMLKASGRVPAVRERKDGTEWGYEKWYDEKTLEASDHPELRGCSLHQVFDLIIQAATGSRYQGNRKSEGFIQATRDAMYSLRIRKAAGNPLQASGFSVHQATDIFDDLANKFLWTGFEAVEVVWPSLTASRNVTDFKTHNLYRFFTKGGYEQVGADGQLVHGGAADDKYTHSADTYGKMYGLTRKELRNDDLGAFDALMTSLGMEAARMQEEIVFSTILGQVGTMWTAGNNNLLTGASSDLTIDGLTSAAELFRKQTEDGAPIMVSPSILLVGSQDEVYADQLMTNTTVREGRGGSKTKEQFTENPHVGKYRPVVSTYLNDTNLTRRTTATIGGTFASQDSDQWFLLADPGVPQGASFVVSLLDGSRTPIIEQSDADFQFLGLQWRAYHDFGCDSAAYQFSVRAAGA